MTTRVIKIRLSDIKRAIDNLARHDGYFLRDLDKSESLSRDHHLISYVVSELYHEEQYNLIVKAIEEHDKPSILIPGTLGAYLFGCLLPAYGDGTRECSPLCIGSVPYPPTAKDSKFCKDNCDHQIWVLQRYSNRVEYVKVNNSKRRTAIIYVDTRFSGFSSYDIQTFVKHGMKRARVMDTTEDGHHIVVNECALNELPMQNGETPVAASDSDSSDNSDQTAVVVLVSVLVVLVIIFILWALLYM